MHGDDRSVNTINDSFCHVTAVIVIAVAVLATWFTSLPAITPLGSATFPVITVKSSAIRVRLYFSRFMKRDLRGRSLIEEMTQPAGCIFMLNVQRRCPDITIDDAVDAL